MSLRLIAGFGAGLGATLAYQEYHDRHGDPPPLGWLRLLLTPRVLGSRRDGGAPKPPRGGNDLRALTRRLEWLEEKLTHPTTTIVTNGSGLSTSATLALLLVASAGAIWSFAWWYQWPKRWADAMNRFEGDLRDMKARIVELGSKVEKESEQTRSTVTEAAEKTREDLSSDIENARTEMRTESENTRTEMRTESENTRRELRVECDRIAELITSKHEQLMTSGGELANRFMRLLVSWGLPASVRTHQTAATRPTRRQLQAAPSNIDTDDSPWTAEL